MKTYLFLNVYFKEWEVFSTSRRQRCNPTSLNKYLDRGTYQMWEPLKKRLVKVEPPDLKLVQSRHKPAGQVLANLLEIQSVDKENFVLLKTSIFQQPFFKSSFLVYFASPVSWNSYYVPMTVK